MKLSIWLQLFGFVLLLLFIGTFDKLFQRQNPSPEDYFKEFPPHNFLLGKRIDIRSATTNELMIVRRVSLKRARTIQEFFRNKPLAKISDVKSISGFGSATVSSLKQYFF